MKDTSKEQVSLFLRGILALGRRLRASRSPGSRTLSGLGILGTLFRVGPLVATQLAVEEGLRPQSLTRVLAELAADKLISRKPSDTDGRAILITLTEKGRRKLLDEIAERRTWLQAAMTSTLTPGERETVNSAAAVLLKIAAYQPGEAQPKTRQIPPDSGPVTSGSNVVFHVSNFGKSLDYYTRILGFEIDFRHGKPVSYAGLSWKNVHLHISATYPYRNNTGHGNFYIYCAEIDRLYARLDAAGVEFYSRISDREYGMRDFAIKDPDGNQIGFGTPVAG